jgi:hypothetical protein
VFPQHDEGLVARGKVTLGAPCGRSTLTSCKRANARGGLGWSQGAGGWCVRDGEVDVGAGVNVGGGGGAVVGVGDGLDDGESEAGAASPVGGVGADEA